MSIKPVLDWDNEQVLNDIRATCPAQLTKTEFITFINTCRSMNLNPFTKEIYCLKNGTNPMQIIVARDGYRKVAQREAEYDYHQTDAVYSNDKFRVYHGEVEHEYDLTDRGKIIGAYCTVKRRSSSKPMYVYVEFKEYDLKRSLWLTKPATMIRKVSEAHALRMAFQAVFVGTYDEDELPEEMLKQNNKPEPAPKPMITEKQVEEIDALMLLGDMSYERIQSAIDKFYKKQELHELTEREAADFIARLQRRVQNELNQGVTNMEAKSTNEETAQGENTETVSAVGTEAHDNHNQLTEIL